MFSDGNNMRQEEKQVLINSCSVLHHRGRFSSFSRSPPVYLCAEGSRGIAGSQLLPDQLPAGLQPWGASLAAGSQGMGRDAGDWRAFVGLFLLLPPSVRFGLEPSVSSLRVLIPAERSPPPRSCTDFWPGRGQNWVAGGLWGWQGVGGAGRLGAGLAPFCPA